MNALDIAVLAALIGAGLGGWRLGFVARLFAWAGVAPGLAVGVHFVPRVVTAFGGTNSDDRVTVALLFLVLAATLGQALGLGVGAVAHRYRTPGQPLPRWDRAAGAFIGGIGVLALLWMTIPSLATAQGWPARMARSSAVVAMLDSVSPEQPAQFAAWGRAISDAPYPSALGPLDDPPDPGLPPEAGVDPEVDERVRESIVKVTGHACRQIQEGSGWITTDGLVVTNAHVVAGDRETIIEDIDGEQHSATVVAFDPVRDLAVLEVDNGDLEGPGLMLGTGEVGDLGAVYGHPGGGPLRAAPARVGEKILAVGSDIYRTGKSERNVLVLAASLAPGDSGGAVVDGDGTVIGVAF
ncbi:MAG: MarP family serine protease, partial [Acidimicrobiia bacterium]